MEEEFSKSLTIDNLPKEVEKPFMVTCERRNRSSAAIGDFDLMRINGCLDRDENFFGRFTGSRGQLENDVAAVGSARRDGRGAQHRLQIGY